MAFGVPHGVLLLQFFLGGVAETDPSSAFSLAYCVLDLGSWNVPYRASGDSEYLDGLEFEFQTRIIKCGDYDYLRARTDGRWATITTATTTTTTTTTITCTSTRRTWDV
ncbi:hypothetical protein K438DRAFT_1756703 [Mycena galopus ATCC 62051]|nr:hypothetical protein K438DRAFT_1756703 [Mycena galopus ATCC 62051]